MDYLPGGTLLEKLNNSEAGLSESQVRSYFRDLMSALLYCHEVKMLAHRDIKPENMMLNKDGKLILCDFGVSQFFESQTGIIKGTMGTVRFMAPECFGSAPNKELQGKPIDIWAAGITLFLLLTKEYPFKGSNLTEIRDLVTCSEPPLEKIQNE